MNLNDVAGFFRTFTGIFSPVFSGLLLAFILSVPKLGIARRLTGVFPRLKEKTVDALSLMACVAVLVCLLCVLAIPQLTASVKSIAVLVRANWPNWAILLNSYGIDTTELTKLAASFNWKMAVEKLFTGAGVVIGSVVDLAVMLNTQTYVPLLLLKSILKSCSIFFLIRKLTMQLRNLGLWTPAL